MYYCKIKIQGVIKYFIQLNYKTKTIIKTKYFYKLTILKLKLMNGIHFIFRILKT